MQVLPASHATIRIAASTLFSSKRLVAPLADQRSGRASRTAPGLCLRLWTQRDHSARASAELPEVKRLDLAETVLTLKAAGVHDLTSFRWIDRPEEKSPARAEQLLIDLGALDSHASEITAIGRRMLRFPIHPRYARMFLAAEEFRCVRRRPHRRPHSVAKSALRAERRVEEERAELFGEGISDFLVLIRAFSYAERHDFGSTLCVRSRSMPKPAAR